jgi:hypothetical protein
MHKPDPTEARTAGEAPSPLYERMLRSFPAYQGIPVCLIGEDTVTFVALGHYPAKHALQAFNAKARELGWSDVLDGEGRHDSKIWRERVLGRIEQTYAIVKDRCDEAGEDDHEEDCYECSAITEAEWHLEWGIEPDVPGAFPVTIWPF